ncbi:SDR family oxidoreductase [Flavobacterium sp. 7A]|uniref:SDR family oxidoreductase n=1 Tax=Flavobacterium sp. 7A TaxID=2940571 RepID=UPI002226BB96|nr:SDR family oxidoreductase [Flavobacterium sp. 7A]MCW2119058.1 uncharacterized protein YbjT (DUF2867 family) [Flavobacterium sp. 7A]
MNKQKQNVLVAGANGTTGKIIIEILKNSNTYEPIAMVRKQSQKEQFEQENVSAVLGDLENDLSDAVKGVHKVIFAAGSKGENVIGVDQEGAKKLVDAAKSAGAIKFVMLSSMGADNPEASKELKDYLKAKQNADIYLKSSGISYSIVRPGSLTNEKGTGSIQLKEKLDKNGKISRADVAQTLVDLLEDSTKHNQTFEIISGEIPIKTAVMN